MKWNRDTEQWETIAAEIDEDFIAAYQSNYGVEYDYGALLCFPVYFTTLDKMTEEFRKEQEAKLKEREEKRKRKAAEEPKPEGKNSYNIHYIFLQGGLIWRIG